MKPSRPNRPSESQAKSRRDRRAVRPRLEGLEARVVQAVGASIFGGRLFVDGDSGQNVITLSHSGGVTFVNGQSFGDSLITNGIEIRTGGNSSNDADTVNIQGMVDETTIDAQGSAAFINLGGTSGIDALAKVSIVNLGLGTSGSTLNIINDRDIQKRTVTIDGDPANGVITGLTSSPSRNISFQSNNLTTLNLSAGSAGNTFNVEHTFRPEGGFFPTRSVAINLFTGTGEDVVNVRGKDAKSVLNIHGQSGIDAVAVGRSGDARGVEGPITIDNAGSLTNLTVDASADSTPKRIDMRSLDLQGQSFQIDGMTGTRGGLNGDTITYKANDINTVFLQGGGGGNSFSVGSTFKAASFASASATIINTGTGNDTVEVFGSGSDAGNGKLFIAGQAGSDTVTLGRNMRSIKGDVDISNLGGLTRLTLDNTQDFSGRGVTVENDPTSAGRGRVTGLAQAKVTFVTNDVSNLDIRTGGAVDTFFVNSTQGRTRTSIRTGLGDDTVFFGFVNNTIDAIQAPVDVDGQGGTNDKLEVRDNLATSPHTYTQTTTSLTRSGAARIGFLSVEDVDVFRGPVAGNAPLVKGLRFARTLRPGQAGVLTGVLNDKDKADKLTLSVDWGDGSAPSVTTPNRKPFAIKHKFAAPGEQTVRVIWTDTQGNSNFKELKVMVGQAKPGRGRRA